MGLSIVLIDLERHIYLFVNHFCECRPQGVIIGPTSLSGYACHRKGVPRINNGASWMNSTK